MTTCTLIRRLTALAATLALTLALQAQTPTKNFNLPADSAMNAIKAFSGQSGVEVLMPTDAVKSIRTNAVRGSMSPREALEKMVEGTGLTVIQDEKTGALGLRANPTTDKKGEDGQLSETAEQLTNAVKLEKYMVLGSRIRRTEFEGPSPVSDYNNDYIKSTGAMTLSDFLNSIPQTYSGIGSGRGSAPSELNPEFAQRTESRSPAFNMVTGASATPPGQTGVSGVSLRGLGSGSTLVLVDGRRASQSGSGNRGTDTRQGFVDLNTIPLGMVDHIEVSTDGASAIYGADAVAGVINIILKKNYTGTEVSAGFKAAEHGGGQERNVSVTTGFSSGKLSGTVVAEYYDRQNLKASERNFSKHQDHRGRVRGTLADGTPSDGRNWLLNWGYPAVIQASGGTVSGNFNAIPGVRVVLVPTGSAATPAVSQFIPVTIPAFGTTVNASQQRRAGSAEFLDLIPESERWGFSGNFNYKFNDRMDSFASFRTSESKSLFNGQPGANTITGSFGAAATLQAAYSPFGQNVTVGMILPEWGSQSQAVRTLDDSLTAGLRGKSGETWEWELGGTWGKQKVRQIDRTFNASRLVGLLNAADPAQRFNPFIDYTATGAPSQAALLETLSLYPSLLGISKSRGLDFQTNGDLFDYWGGTVKMAFGGSTDRNEVESTAVKFSSSLTPVATTTMVMGSQTTNALFTEFQLPIFGKSNARPGLRRLDFNIAARREDNGRFAKTVPKVGVSWTPVQTLLMRASWSEGFRAPGITEYLIAPSARNLNVNDLRRTPVVTRVSTTTGSNSEPKPELSENTFVGFVFEPEFAKGLNLQVNYYSTQQKDVLQQLSLQDIVNNEAIFGDRVIRGAATAADILLGQPGAITTVDQTFVSFGEVINRSMDVVIDYRLPWEQLGRFRVNIAASRTLEASRKLSPGQPSVILDDTTAAPPKWRVNSALFWNKNNWNGSAFLSRVDGFTNNNAGNNLVSNSTAITFFPTPAVTKLDLRIGYEFRKGLWREYGKGLRVSLGINNVFDKEPPYSDTVWGFNAGIHSQYILGRSYEFSFVQPF